jgi:hypothetical protein
MELTRIWQKENKKRAYLNTFNTMKYLGWEIPKPRTATLNGKSISYYQYQKTSGYLEGSYYDMVSKKWHWGNRVDTKLSTEEFELIKTKVLEEVGE